MQHVTPDKIQPPPFLISIEQATQEIGFTMGSDRLTGSLLRTLVAAKPAAGVLELGTGTGLATAWLLDGMDSNATLITVDQDERAPAIARKFLGKDPRITFVTMSGVTFIETAQREEQRFDFIFADMQPGKFQLLEETLTLLNPGGLYVVDDLLPVPGWEPGHAGRVSDFITALEQRTDLHITQLSWSVGLLIAAKTA